MILVKAIWHALVVVCAPAFWLLSLSYLAVAAYLGFSDIGSALIIGVIVMLILGVRRIMVPRFMPSATANVIGVIVLVVFGYRDTIMLFLPPNLRDFFPNLRDFFQGVGKSIDHLIYMLGF